MNIQLSASPGGEFDSERAQSLLDRLQELVGGLQQPGAPLTLFVDVNEHLWVKEHNPDLARCAEALWSDAVGGGHDVQMLLDSRHAAGDLPELVRCAKAALESAVRPRTPSYEVVAHRAAAGPRQPFARLYDALLASGIPCDASVVPGAKPGDGRDYTYAYHDHQPWLAARHDPQLKAPPAERALVEIPTSALHPGQAWTFEGDAGARFAPDLLRRLAEEQRRPSPGLRRLGRLVRRPLNEAYRRLRPMRRAVNRVLPRKLAAFMAPYDRERLVTNDYFVLTARLGASLDLASIRDGVDQLRARPELELVTMRELAATARTDLVRDPKHGPIQEAERQVRLEYATQMGSDRHFAQAALLRELVPRQSRHILDAGCGRGVGSLALAREFPRATVVGADVGEDFIARANAEYAADRLSFVAEDFARLSFADGEFDCVHADNSLEHAFDVDLTLRELYRVLSPGGCLVAALPPDGINPGRTCENHTWKTIPSDVEARLRAAGFSRLELRLVDIFRDLGAPPYPPSNDLMLYFRAWKDSPAPQLDER